jgi:hypothetical protein
MDQLMVSSVLELLSPRSILKNCRELEQRSAKQFLQTSIGGMMNARFASLVDTQLLLFKLSTVTFCRAVQFWVQLADRQIHVFGGLGEEEHRSHPAIPRGPSLVDHYGRREHDIDPEHDV